MNFKEAREKSENGLRKKINGRLKLVMKEINEKDKRNREWQERKEQMKMARTRAKG